MAIIFVVRIEARKRYGTSEVVPSSNLKEDPPESELKFTSPPTTDAGDADDDDKPRVLRWAKAFTGTMQSLKRRFRSWLDERKSEQDGDMEQSSKNDGKLSRRKRETTQENEEEVMVSSRLGEELLTEALQGHKVRSIEKKVQKLSPHDQLVQAILQHFQVSGGRSSAHFPMISSHSSSLRNSSDDKSVPDQNESDPENHLSSTKFETNEEGTSDVKTTFSSNSRVEEDGAYGNQNHDQVGHSHLHHVPSIVCQSYGEVFVTVIATTTVNIIIFVMILICRNLLLEDKWKSSCWEDESTFDRLVDSDNFNGDPLYIQITDPERRLSI